MSDVLVLERGLLRWCFRTSAGTCATVWEAALWRMRKNFTLVFRV